MEVRNVKLSIVLDILNPFERNPWGCDGLLTREMIDKTAPVEELYSINSIEGQTWWEIERHAGRVKYLSQIDFPPIEIDVGVPVLGYYHRTVIDGCHRIAAAVYRGDTTIACFVGGQIDSI